MKPPETIYIAGTPIQVLMDTARLKEWNKDKEKSDDIWGTANEAERFILMRDDLRPEQAQETLWHELLHWLDWVYQTAGKRMSEAQAQQTARGLAWLFRDNPQLVGYLGSREA